MGLGFSKMRNVSHGKIWSPFRAVRLPLFQVSQWPFSSFGGCQVGLLQIVFFGSDGCMVCPEPMLYFAVWPSELLGRRVLMGLVDVRHSGKPASSKGGAALFPGMPVSTSQRHFVIQARQLYFTQGRQLFWKMPALLLPGMPASLLRGPSVYHIGVIVRH